MHNPNISILLPAYKSDQLLSKIFYPSFVNNTKVDVELILYDNGGNDNFIKYIKETNAIRVKIIGDANNIGLNKALNLCAKEATGDYFYLSHTDMCLMSNWDISLLKAAKNQAPTSFLFCSRSIEKASHIPTQLIKDFGTNIENFKEKELYEFFKTYNDKGIVTSYRMPYFLSKQLWEKMNGVDEQFFSYATDNDLFFTAYDKGVRKFWMINESVVYHLSGHSNNQQSIDKNDKEPYYKLCEKWSKYNITMNIDQSEQNLVPWNIKVK